MLILSDFEIRDPAWFQNLPVEVLAKILDLKEFIYHRISGLRKEMEQEESVQERAFTVIYILPGVKVGQVEFIYSRELTEKLQACFSNEDRRQLTDMIN